MNHSTLSDGTMRSVALSEVEFNNMDSLPYLVQPRNSKTPKIRTHMQSIIKKRSKLNMKCKKELMYLQE